MYDDGAAEQNPLLPVINFTARAGAAAVAQREHRLCNPSLTYFPSHLHSEVGLLD